jgi:hypothetical protein
VLLRSIPGQPRGHLPHGHLGIDVQLSERPGHGYAVMPVTNKVDVPNLDQHHGRQHFALITRRCDAQPATRAVILNRVEIAIEIFASALAAADLTDRYIPYPSVAASPYIAGIFHF